MAPWVSLPLFISATTGLFYRVSKDLLGYSRDEVHWLMSLHEGEWLGENGDLLYVFLNSLALLRMLVTGAKMLSKKFHFQKRLLKASQKVKIKVL